MNVKVWVLALLSLSLIIFQSCDDDDNVTPAVNNTDDVFELAVRRINPGVSIDDFTAARDAFVAKLVAEDGAFNDREVQPFFDYLGSGLPLDSVYIGLTQYEDLDTYTSLAQSLSTIPEAQAFLGTFSPLVFEALRPIEGYIPVDLSEVAPLGTGHVWEIAVRDLNSYPNFDQADYEAKRDAFVQKLAEQNGTLREIQWESAINPGIVVGMTIYESQAAVIAINSDTTFTNSTESVEFISAYPPTVFGTLNTVLK